jgi:hypothetical protein
MSSKEFSGRAPKLGLNATVTTPSGRAAQVITLHPVEGEATVQWPDNERGRFKVMNLRPVEKEGPT